jgi:ribonucleoside-diphosphate reductase alpha chain
MLAALGLEYGSENATDFSEEIHKTVALESYRSSVYLAKERGPFTFITPKGRKTIRSSTGFKRCRSFTL